ncbi:MAG: helix-turn-helix transcriptional regulator [Lewinella sp.]|nr:helix-turn-helix transcriptional regulator [Lewinella sp.]
MSYFQALTNFINRGLYHPELTPEALVRKHLAWNWLIIGLFGLLGITALALWLKARLLLWCCVTLLAYDLLTLPMFFLLRDFGSVLFGYLLLVLLTIFSFMLLMGGITTSSGLALTGLGVLLGATAFFNDLRKVTALFVVYLVTIVITGLLEPRLSLPPDHQPSTNVFFFVLHLIGLAGAGCLFALYYLHRPPFEAERSAHPTTLNEARANGRAPLTMVPDMARQRMANHTEHFDDTAAMMSKRGLTRPAGDAFLQRVFAVINDHLADEQFKIDQLCQEMAISRAQLYRKFEALTDMPIGKFIRTLRLHQARRLIEAGDCNVTQAALRSGFRNLSHFSAAFKEEFGVNPSDLLA